jgi:hypothetical protein
MFTGRFAAPVARTTLTAAALGLAALGFAGTAGASSVDDAFLAQLQADGITPPSAARRQRWTRRLQSARQRPLGPGGHQRGSRSTGLSSKGAKTFAVDAASADCPQYVTSS